MLSTNSDLPADDAALYVHTKDKTQAAKQLTAVMSNVCNWLESSHLHLNVSKSDTDPNIFVREKTLEVVQEFKYLGVILDSQLNSKQHTQKKTEQNEI